MKLLHTSDWHLGRTLYGRRRDAEFEAFLSWLLQQLRTEQVDVLLLAGDVFDTTTPSHSAQQLYYRFLWQAADCCRHVVIIGGNHDSPSFLNAPKELLRGLDVHVIGAIDGDPAQEVLVLEDAGGAPALIVCAVPFLRERDIRQAEAGEDLSQKEQRLQLAIADHYACVCQLAEQQRQSLGGGIPLVVMGHLFTAGGSRVEGDGVRDLYVGSLAHLPIRLFPAGIDYLALGHLHVPQMIAGQPHLRYSGSPLPMGFGELAQPKSVSVVEFQQREPQVRLLPVPRFQALEQISGDWPTLSARLDQLLATGEGVWLELIHQGDERVVDLREQVQQRIAGSALEVLRIRDRRIESPILQALEQEESLQQLDPEQVFERCLDAHEVPRGQRDGLWQAYREVLLVLQQQDPAAE